MYYVTALAADQTVNTIPEPTLLAFGHHGKVGALLSEDSTDAEAVIGGIRKAGIDVDILAEQLQIEGRDSFGDSFTKLLQSIDTKKVTLRKTRDRET
jgi:transaldolase